MMVSALRPPLHAVIFACQAAVLALATTVRAAVVALRDLRVAPDFRLVSVRVLRELGLENVPLVALQASYSSVHEPLSLQQERMRP